MGITPMMQQYLEIKRKYEDCIIFFRLGDFYEMFFEDAKTASIELELTLTGRDCGLEERAPMCGIPYHAANSYIGRLINKGYKIAICEQLEDPALAKTIVKRDVIKIITPGTYTDENYLEEEKNNYIMSLYFDDMEGIFALSFIDISTGEFLCTQVIQNMDTTINEISKYNVREMICSDNVPSELIISIKEKFSLVITTYNLAYFSETSQEDIEAHFQSLRNVKFTKAMEQSSRGLIRYLHYALKNSLSHITAAEVYSVVDYMIMNYNTRKNLELTESLKDFQKKGSLLWVLDKTSTAMGSRLIRKWIEQPLINKKAIEERLSSIEELINNISLEEELQELLKGIYDVERIAGKVSTNNVNPRELISLKQSLQRLPLIKECLSRFEAPEISGFYDKIDLMEDMTRLLDRAIDDNPSISSKEGNIIKNGYNSTVDELRLAKSSGRQWIAALETKERERTGIKSLKVGYNKVFGYYIEITNANLALSPEDYTRKQTLSNAERFITPELKEMEYKILGADDKLKALEYEIFSEVREYIESNVQRIKNTAQVLAVLDCLCALASTALYNNYTKPSINTEGIIHIKAGRHPVVERVLPPGTYVNNDVYMDKGNSQLLLITGPNMAGKSTYMRQIALITLMAQMGSYVPAEYANISICDKVFTRIGASDDLASGKSTFMVEMWEVSNILHNATPDSLVLLDEVGRGTSTYDGLSIAWSVIEYICGMDKLKCKTLFATHYHELTALEDSISGVKNFSIAVKEVGTEIVFLRKIIPGGADQSYGIEVAKLAGLPEQVLNRARELLKTLEKEKNTKTEEKYIKGKKENAMLREAAADHSGIVQMNFTDIERDNLIKSIKDIDLYNLTPMESMNMLYELIKRCKNL